MCAPCVVLILRWWEKNKERVREHQQHVATYRNSCAAHNNDAFSWGSRASSSQDTWTPATWTPAPAVPPPPVVPDTPASVVPDPTAPQAPPNNSNQQQLFQMHQSLAQHQMTMMTQLAQSNSEQSQAMLRTMMEVILCMNNA